MLDLSRLSPAQRQVALAPAGPLLVVAGPGSGKTTALTGRIAVLVATHGGDGVLALTFTAAAARELRQRLGRILGHAGHRVDVATFHSFGLRIARRWSAALDLGAGPIAVYGAADARRLLDEAARRTGWDGNRSPDAGLAARVERLRLATPRFDRVGSPEGSGVPPPRPDGGQAELAALAVLAGTYERLLRERGAVDFPAMLALPLRLFDCRPDALRLYQDTYRHLLCDEFQDLCPAQYGLLTRLAERHRSLTAVGDPLQTIYGWRGADVRFLLEFRRDFPEAQVLSLDQNFRSTRRIVAFANALGAPLGERRDLWTENPAGPAVALHVAADGRAEAAFIAGEIARLLDTGAITTPDEAAILYRTNRQAHDLTLALRARGIPYHVVGAGDLFARREVRAAVAYLRLAHNPADTAALVRVLNAPPRGLAGLARHIERFGATVEHLPALAGAHAPEAVPAAASLAALIHSLHARSRAAPPAGPGELLDEALERSGYRAWLTGLRDGEARQEHLTTLRALAQSGGDLESWLTELQLGEAGDAPAEGTDGTRGVVLTTVHAAKGKEWRVVFVAGVEDGLLPHARALLESSDPAGLLGAPGAPGAGLEEELRVAYVAVTRPRDRLYLTCCRARRHGEALEARRPSRFLRHVPPGLLRRAA